MIDFKELPDDGVLFEQFIRELYLREDYEVHWTGIGPDAGRDLVLTEKLTGPLSTRERKWLISCKHKAHSNQSVGIGDLGDFSADCAAIGAEGYILACSTQPSSSAVKRLEEVSVSKKLITKFEDAISLEKRLMRPNTFSLIDQFFPETAKKFSWQIYNAFSPSFWLANYKGFFFYLSSRTATTFPDLDDCEQIITVISDIKLPKSKAFQTLRPRAIYYDNKHCTYTVYLDYMTDGKQPDIFSGKDILSQIRTLLFEKFVERNFKDINMPDWDLKRVQCSIGSGHYHEDHKSYYEPYVDTYREGSPRWYL